MQAQFTCLTCNCQLLCETCKIRHTLKKGHQLINHIYKEGTVILTKELMCDVHKLDFTLYCQNDHMAICQGCLVKDSTSAGEDYYQHHNGHTVQPLEETLARAKEHSNKQNETIDDWETRLTAAISYFSGIKDIYTEQRDLFLKKITADFEVI